MKTFILILMVVGVAALIAFFLVPRFAPLTSASDEPASVVSDDPPEVGEEEPAAVSDNNRGLADVIAGKPYVELQEPNTDQITQGKTYTVRWRASGVDKVTVVAYGKKVSYTDRNRGKVREVLAESVPAGQNGVDWTVPFLDARKFRIIVKGYDANGRVTAVTDKVYLFRPDILASRTADGIYLDLRNQNVQRLYVLKDNKVIRAYLTSGAASNAFYPPDTHPKTTHDHPGVYKVIEKYPNWYSSQFSVDMPWAMRYLNGHFIHATSPNLYSKLGTAASHGCNRLTLEQAKELYDMTPVGTRVEIIVK